MDLMVSYIRLAWKLACMLKTYRTCNSTVRFSIYEFNNKLYGVIILLRVTPEITWTQPIYIYREREREKERERERERWVQVTPGVTS